MSTQRHWLQHWWFRAIILLALVLALMLAVRLHSATGGKTHTNARDAAIVLTASPSTPSE